MHHTLAFVLILLTAAGCAREQSAGKSDGSSKRLEIAVIPKGTTHVFWKSVHAGAL